MLAATRIRAALKFALLMTLLQFGHSNYIRDYEDISQFYSDGARILTLNTTMGASECKYDKVTKHYNKKAEFTRYYGSGATKRSLDLVGHFVNHRHRWTPVELDTMDVKKKAGDSFSTERLLHAFDNGNCGIFSVTRNWGGRGNDYELRVKIGNDGHGKCYNKFKSDTERAGVFTKVKPCKKP
uniref:Putative group i salivary lipocalin n=1 Tax=Rhipicephalus pulchellus TaxID=72859 RepID=L7LQG2_RHIPC